MNNETTLQKDKVLVVEDDKAIRESLQDILELKGYEVFTSVNGRKGLVAVIKEKPDLVICDINMPLMNGFELLQSLNECMEKEIVPPFLFLTARATNSDIRKGMELGADDYITKPFNPLELLEIVKSKISKRKKIISYAAFGEKNRISSELHDGIQQLLVASQMGFKTIKEEVTKQVDYDTQNIFERSLDFLIEASNEVRNISHEIVEKKEIDLKAKIELLFKHLKDTGEIDTYFIYNVNKELDNFKKMQKA
ncbi:MAG: response regulator [Bacteroidetes bacterium]|nr:response regulator [Bacteroidota bacterium]